MKELNKTHHIYTKHINIHTHNAKAIKGGTQTSVIIKAKGIYKNQQWSLISFKQMAYYEIWVKN